MGPRHSSWVQPAWCPANTARAIMNVAAKLPKRETHIYDACWWEAAWHYRHRASAGKTIKKRRQGQPQAVVSIAERADQRLNRKFRRMVDRYNKKPVIAAGAVARELAGFIWAIGQIQD